MHLWPSLKIRDSFKSSRLKKFQRTSSTKQSQSNQEKLLNNKESGPEVPSTFAVVCREVAMALTCCFCCGACDDDEEN